MSDDMVDPEIMYGMTNSKQKRNKQNRQIDSTLVLTNLYEMFPDLEEKVIENTYYQMKKDLDQVINKLVILPRKENKVDSYFKEIGHYVSTNNNNNDNNNSNSNTNTITYNNSITEQLNEIQYQSNLAEMSETVRFVFGDNQDYNIIMEECQTSIINFLGRDDFNYSDILGVDSSQIPEQYALEIQQFMEQIIFKKNFEVVDNMDDFPPIPEIEGDNPFINEKLQKKLFIENNSGFYCGKSRKEQINDENFIRQLCEQFPQITYSKIKYAYEQFENYDQCRQFLKQYYNHEYQPKRERKKAEIQYSPQKDFGQKKIFDKRLLNPNDIRLELQRNRKNIQNLYCQKETFDRCVGIESLQCRKTREYYKCCQFLKLSDLYNEARCLVIELMEAEGTYDKVDLHGFYGVEIEGILDDICELIQKVKTTKKHQLEIVVGKGIHSKNRQSVIRPVTERYLKYKGIAITSNSDGKIIVKL